MVFTKKKSFGYTPLHRAVIDNDLEGVKKHLALAGQGNCYGLKAADLARFLGRDTLVPLFKPLSVPPCTMMTKEKEIKPLTVEELEARFHFTFTPTLQFESLDILEWSHRCTEKRLRRSLFSAMNHWTCALHQRAYAQGIPDYFSLRFVNPLVGYGLYAKKPIPKLTYIGEYTGEVRKRTKRRDRFNDYVFGFICGPKRTPYVIDAKEKGNLTRFINHSDDPNCVSRWIVVDGLTHIIFFAKRAIQRGEQLTYDYGKYYWRSRSFPQTL